MQASAKAAKYPHIVISHKCLKIGLLKIQPLKAVHGFVLPMASSWVGRLEKSCLGCISETVRYNKFILVGDNDWGVVDGQHNVATLI